LGISFAEVQLDILQHIIHPSVSHTPLWQRGNGFKLEEDRFGLDIKKKSFTLSVVRHWNRLPSKVVNTLSLEAFKARQDGDLSNLV